MKKIFTILLIALSLSAYSQVEFEKGYIIDNESKLDSVLIKNRGWLENDITIVYKKLNTDKEIIATIDDIQEFGIGDNIKFKRFTIDIDKSSSNLDYLSTERNPKFITETVFLKVLVKGEATLYKYAKGDVIRFFFNINNNQVKQLVYKMYSNSSNQVKKNESFKQQLMLNLKCSDISNKHITQLSYRESDLVKLFVKYNKCKNSSFTNFVTNHKKTSFNLYARIGVNSSSLSINKGTVNFENKKSLRFGAEMEFIMPFNKNKWSIILEPAYYLNYAPKPIYKPIIIHELYRDESVCEINYRYFEIPIGIRHYFFITERSKIFINASFLIYSKSNSTIKFYLSDSKRILKSVDIDIRPNFRLGIGYNLNSRFSFEIRLQTPDELVQKNHTTKTGYLDKSYKYISTEFRNISVIVGYNIF